MAIITLDDFKLFNNISDTTKDELYQLYIDAACDLVKKYTHRDLESTEYTEVYDGPRSCSLVLNQFPVSEIDTILVDTEEIEVYDATDNPSGYQLDSANGIVHLTSMWPAGRKIINIVYTAGFDTIPADLKYATLSVASYMRNLKNRQGIRSESLGTYNVNLMNELQGDAIIPDLMTKNILDRYKDRTRHNIY